MTKIIGPSVTSHHNPYALLHPTYGLEYKPPCIENNFLSRDNLDIFFIQKRLDSAIYVWLQHIQARLAGTYGPWT